MLRSLVRVQLAPPISCPVDGWIPCLQRTHMCTTSLSQRPGPPGLASNSRDNPGVVPRGRRQPPGGRYPNGTLTEASTSAGVKRATVRTFAPPAAVTASTTPAAVVASGKSMIK